MLLLSLDISDSMSANPSCATCCCLRSFTIQAAFFSLSTVLLTNELLVACFNVAAGSATAPLTSVSEGDTAATGAAVRGDVEADTFCAAAVGAPDATAVVEKNLAGAAANAERGDDEEDEGDEEKQEEDEGDDEKEEEEEEGVGLK